MGVIIKQSIRYSLVNYVGIILGFVNVILIYPFFLTESELGKMRFLIDTPMLIMPFVTLGAGIVSIRFFPKFRDDSKDHFNNGLLFLITTIPLIGFSILVLVSLFTFFFTDYSGKLISEIQYLLPLTFFIAYSSIFNSYCISYKKIAIPAIFSNLYPKLLVPICAIIYYYFLYDESQFYYALIAVYALAFFSFLIYLRRLGLLNFKPNLSFLSKDKVKEMGTFGAYSTIGKLSTLLAYRLDTFMLSVLLGYSSTGIYSVGLALSNVIDVPNQSIHHISTGIISEAWNNNDLEKIKDIYYKSCLNQFIMATVLFVLIYSMLDVLFTIMPNGEVYAGSKMVVVVLGLARVMDSLTGVNNAVINHSKHFRFLFYAILIMAAMNISFNLIFVKYLGMYGVALSTLVSLTIYNLIKYFFILNKFKLQPINKNILKVFVLALIFFTMAYFLPSTGYIIMDILMNGVLFGICYPLLIIKLEISPDINNLFYKGLEAVLNKLK